MYIQPSKYGITFKNGALCRHGRKVTNKEKLIQEIARDCRDLPLSKIEDIIDSWEQEAFNQSGENADDFIKEIIQKSNILKNFVILKEENNQLIHYKKDNEFKFISSIPPKNKELVNMLRTYEPEKFQALREAIAPVIRPKLYSTLDDESIADIIFNVSNFFTDQNFVIKLDRPLKPITLNNQDLAYKNLNVVFTDTPKLNPYLKEFLDRVSDHERLCAILWLMFNGIKTPYVVYLYGGGGDGKSSFINMLCKAVKSYGALELDGLFKYFHIYGKALITLTENTDIYLMQNKMVKEITGRSPVSCQEKGKTSFTAVIEGLLMVDSNKNLKLVGEEFEFRRLRHFTVSPVSKKVVKINPDLYTEKLSENFDQFISYCKKCYEAVGINHLVEPSIEMNQAMIGLVDQLQVFEYEEFLKKIGYVVDLTSNVEEFEVYSRILRKRQSVSNNKFFVDNFMRYLKLKYGVDRQNGIFSGLRNK